MKIVFFGTPNYVLPILETLHKTFKTKSGESPIVAVVTQKPRPSGRKKLLTYSPVDNWAYKKRVPIYFQAEGLIREEIKADLGILAAYGEIIPKSVINHFSFGILNAHPSLLPEFRGASPVQATLATGRAAGVTIIKIDEKLDHGQIVSQFKEVVFEDETTATLRERLFKRSADVLTTLIPAYLKGKIKLKEQDHDKATYTMLLKKEHGFIDPKGLKTAIEGRKIDKAWKIDFINNYTSHYSPVTIHNSIRAMQPWPVAWTYVQLTEKQKKLKTKKRLKILKTHLKEKSNVKSQMSKVLILDEVQLEGKNPVSFKQFKEAYPEATFT